MYNRSIESDPKAHARHVFNMRKDSADRLAKNAEWKRKHGKTDTSKPGRPNRKALKCLDRRLSSYSSTLNDPANRGKDMIGYRRPGSMQIPN